MRKIIKGCKRIGNIGLVRKSVGWFGEKKEEGNGGNENNNRNRRNLLKKVGFGICAASLSYLFYNIHISAKSPNSLVEDAPKPLKSSKIQLGGEWKLQDCSKNLFSSDQLKGNFYLIYFGYAFCPDICPTTLNYLGNVYRQYQNINHQSNLKVVFVSVDPKRDKPETVKKYLRLFDPTFIGLTARD